MDKSVIDSGEYVCVWEGGGLSVVIVTLKKKNFFNGIPDMKTLK